MTVSITKPTVGATSGWGPTLNTALDAIVAEVNTLGSGTVATSKKTADYTPALTDAGSVVEFDSTGTVTFTVPPVGSVAFAVGTVIELCQVGTGSTFVTPAAGVALASPGGKRKLSGQFSSASLRRRGAGAIQYSRPSGLFSQSASNWLSAPYDSKLNEVTPDDSTFITSAGNSQVIDLTMSAVGTPADRTANSHVLSFRAKRASGTNNAGLTVKVKQGGTVIRSSGTAYPLNDAFTLYTVALTGTEAAAITDYSALRVEIDVFEVANAGTAITAAVSWIQLQVPGAADEWILAGDISL